jgi:hypothetical protein
MTSVDVHGGARSPSMWRNNGLSIVLVLLFAVSLGGQAVTGWYDHNESERQHGGQPTGFGQYL